MAKAGALVGVDVHATKLVAAVLDAETGELQCFGWRASAARSSPSPPPANSPASGPPQATTHRERAKPRLIRLTSRGPYQLRPVTVLTACARSERSDSLSHRTFEDLVGPFERPAAPYPRVAWDATHDATVRPMPWIDAVNAGLARATGYRLVKNDQVPAAPAKRRKRRLPRNYDKEARQIIRTVRPRTMTAHEKVWALILATRYVVDHSIPGAIVECGVWRGGSMQAAALDLLGRGVDDRELHLFDTFEGMPPPTETDVRWDGRPAADVGANSPKSGTFWAIAGLEDVRAGMAETGYPQERIHFHRGRVEDTVPTQAPERIALLRLDTDWYESTRHELEHLYDRVASGGVLMIDDYAYWQGARQAVDEFLERRSVRLLLVPMASGRIAVKH